MTNGAKVKQKNNPTRNKSRGAELEYSGKKSSCHVKWGRENKGHSEGLEQELPEQGSRGGTGPGGRQGQGRAPKSLFAERREGCYHVGWYLMCGMAPDGFSGTAEGGGRG